MTTYRQQGNKTFIYFIIISDFVNYWPHNMWFYSLILKPSTKLNPSNVSRWILLFKSLYTLKCYVLNTSGKVAIIIHIITFMVVHRRPILRNEIIFSQLFCSYKTSSVKLLCCWNLSAFLLVFIVKSTFRYQWDKPKERHTYFNDIPASLTIF